MLSFQRALVSVVVPVLMAHAGCALFHTAARPAAYGAELAACEADAPAGPAGWEKYTPCCTDVARRYDRDPSFCFPDGGE